MNGAHAQFVFVLSEDCGLRGLGIEKGSDFGIGEQWGKVVGSGDAASIF